jgi:hypothetical protein
LHSQAVEHVQQLGAVHVIVRQHMQDRSSERFLTRRRVERIYKQLIQPSFIACRTGCPGETAVRGGKPPLQLDERRLCW